CLRASPTTELDPLSLHAALPICREALHRRRRMLAQRREDVVRKAAQLDAVPLDQRRQRLLVPRLELRDHVGRLREARGFDDLLRSEEHTSELQSRENLVCRLLLE